MKRLTARLTRSSPTRKSKVKSVTFEGVQDEDDDPSPRRRRPLDSVRAVAREQEGPDKQEGFRELLERLSNAHDMELCGTVDRLESEKAELERQNGALRGQLASQRARPSDCGANWPVSAAGPAGQLPAGWAAVQPPTSKDKRKTHDVAGGASPLGRPGGLVSLAPRSPFMLDASDTDWAPVRNRDPAAGEEAGEQDASRTTTDEAERFPSRSEYMEKLGELGTILEEAQPFKDHSDRQLARSWRSRVARSEGTSIQSILHDKFWASFIASPRSRARLAWQGVGAVLILWDLFVVPMAAFCYPVSGVTTAMEWITLLYWTLNVPQTLTVGYEEGLRTVMSPSSILIAYLKRWFLIDMVVLVPDWIIVVLSFGTSSKRHTSCDSAGVGAGAVKLLRNLRLMRIMRLTRIARLHPLWQLVKERIYSLTVNIVANVCTMLMVLMVISHFIGCSWYAISYYATGENRWIVHYEMEGLSWSYLYMTCLHWSLCQFTPAPIDIQPQNLSERVFNVFVVVYALVGFSYVVGKITGSLAQLRNLQEEESKLFWDLRIYLKRNNVQHFLAVRIQRYLQNAWRYQASNKTYQDIKVLTMLSEQLENELLFQLHGSHLTIHPLIQKMLEVSKVTAFRLARAAVSTKQLAVHDHLFIHGEQPSHLYIVVQGRFQYRRLSRKGEVSREMVEANEDWIAEPVLWSAEWYHLGDCTAVEESSLMLVSPEHFSMEAKRNPPAWVLVTTYCKNFLKWLNATDPEELSDITPVDQRDQALLLRRLMLIERSNKLEAAKSPPRDDTGILYTAVCKINHS